MNVGYVQVASSGILNFENFFKTCILFLLKQKAYLTTTKICC